MTLIAYANPAKGKISINLDRFTEQEQIDISVFNVKGKRIYHQVFLRNNSKDVELNTSIIPGVYFIKVQGTRNVISQKVIAP